MTANFRRLLVEGRRRKSSSITVEVADFRGWMLFVLAAAAAAIVVVSRGISDEGLIRKRE